MAQATLHRAWFAIISLTHVHAISRENPRCSFPGRLVQQFEDDLRRLKKFQSGKSKAGRTVWKRRLKKFQSGKSKAGRTV